MWSISSIGNIPAFMYMYINVWTVEVPWCSVENIPAFMYMYMWTVEVPWSSVGIIPALIYMYIYVDCRSTLCSV